MGRYIAVDLGATSGRVALVDTNSGTFDINVVHRFPHEVITNEDGAMRWDWEYILKESIVGIRKAADLGPVTSLAIDSWAVDFGFLDSTGKELLPIRSYRDPRNQVALEATLAKYGKERIYQTTGIQFLSLNSIYQLMAAKEDPNYVAGAQFLLVPDFMNHALTGVASTEITNASTTQLLDTKSRTWDYELIELLGLRASLFPALHEPGSDLGVIRGHGSLDGIKVVATGSHDTASAVAGAPIENAEIEAYLSSGTWSLLGIESSVPFRGSDAFAINLTNELGVENTVRVLKNITGLWIFEECRRSWRGEGSTTELTELIALAEKSSVTSIIDPNNLLFATPGDMPHKVARFCRESNQPEPQSHGDFIRCIFISLALAYKKTLEEIEEVTGKKITKIHILGGGSQIHLLNQMAADATGCVISAGPTEATLIGNVAMQAIASGEFANLSEARNAIRKSLAPMLFVPQKH